MTTGSTEYSLPLQVEQVESPITGTVYCVYRNSRGSCVLILLAVEAFRVKKKAQAASKVRRRIQVPWKTYPALKIRYQDQITILTILSPA